MTSFVRGGKGMGRSSSFSPPYEGGVRGGVFASPRGVRYSIVKRSSPDPTLAGRRARGDPGSPRRATRLRSNGAPTTMGSSVDRSLTRNADRESIADSPNPRASIIGDDPWLLRVAPSGGFKPV